ncbi:hypothetical protein GCE86_08750 [Micromonospora terminaliae]|uniref:Uncharacterized protein n=1 Tax=Micromonospora terminaliae TaxID=1914461 RepID=A0AAJ2ZFT6_9ACTN|nr:hypothetical protein [Micromonospora terminaliae]NES28124.1 hypothetical protein [Micromonospora terminaliae]QGL47130.1 hypothetical protein GCE86_08750 [Micromonospora terminaliae]
MVLPDRMGCLKGAVVVNVVFPTVQYVRSAAHYGFRPDFCGAKDPESKKARSRPQCAVAKSELVVPAEGFGGDLSVANAAVVA